MEKRIIEINGIKMEIDMSTAKRVDEFKVGDNIKVLQNKQIKQGVIVDFVNFKELPTIQIAIFSTDYWGSKIDFIHYNAKTEDIEIMPCAKLDLELEKNNVVEKLNNEIQKKSDEMSELVAKRDWFVKYYGKYFENKCN